MPYEEGGNFSNLLQDPGTFAAGQAVTFTTVGPGTGHSIYQPDYKDIEPRIGFSWDPWGNGKTAVRAGFGIFHARVFGNEVENARADPPFQGRLYQLPGGDPQQCLGQRRFPDRNSHTNAICQRSRWQRRYATVIFDTHFPNSAANNWNLDIQRQLPGNNVIDIAYVGSMGVHVYGEKDGNPPDPGLV